MYNTKDFAIDRNNGRLYTTIGTSVTPIDLYGALPEDSQNNMPILTTTPNQLMLPTQATSTAVTETNIGTPANSVPRKSIPIPTPARIPTPTSTVPVTTVYQPQASHAPTEAEIVATHEALLESLTLSSSSSDRSLTHQKEKIPTSQLSKIIPSTQKEARKTYPISTQTIQEPERRSTTTPARTSQPRGFKPMTLTTVVSTIIPATHPTQMSEMSIISSMTTTVLTTATRIIPIELWKL